MEIHNIDTSNNNGNKRKGPPVLPHTRHIDLCRQDIESSYHAGNTVLGNGKAPQQHFAIYTQTFNNKYHSGKKIVLTSVETRIFIPPPTSQTP